MQFFASVSYIKPFFLILVSLCVVMFQWLSDVVLFHFLLPAILSLPLSHSVFSLMLVFLFLPHSKVITHYAVLTKHSKYTSGCWYVYYCVAQVAGKTGSWESNFSQGARELGVEKAFSLK